MNTKSKLGNFLNAVKRIFITEKNPMIESMGTKTVGTHRGINYAGECHDKHKEDLSNNFRTNSNY